MGYGTEKRVILLHGPVGSSKSTIARLMKKGLEAYSHTEGQTLHVKWRIRKSSVQHLRAALMCCLIQ